MTVIYEKLVALAEVGFRARVVEGDVITTDNGCAEVRP
jgi:hypothetical protein